MKKRYAFNVIFLFVCFASTNKSFTQNKSAGPIIEAYGPVFKVPNADYPTDMNHTFKVVYDIVDSAQEKNQLNPYLESVARFLNMHAQAGIPSSQLKPVVVVHNVATTDVLGDQAYKERFGTENPNSGLLRALMDSGVEVILCGQSALSRNVPIEQTVPGTKLALSAMTALIQYQDMGYQLIKY